MTITVRPRFFDQVVHETMYASGVNKHFFTKSCQNYELGTILGNKVCILKIKISQNILLRKVGLLKVS